MDTSLDEHYGFARRSRRLRRPRVALGRDDKRERTPFSALPEIHQPNPGRGRGEAPRVAKRLIVARCFAVIRLLRVRLPFGRDRR
jgi:hypothetical protein